MPAKKTSNLTDYRISELEKDVSELKAEVKWVREESIKIVAKIALVGSLIGSLGTFILQKLWK